MKKGISTQQLAFLAFAAVINIIGGYIALFLHLPIYLDSIGTILISAVLGPIYGMAPSLLSNLVLGMMGDVYAFYYLPVGMLLGALNGWLWNKPVAFVFVRPERYTYEFIEKSDYLTLSFLGEENKKIHAVCGSKSGRNTDKVKETGLKPVFTEGGNVVFEQARLSLECKKLYADGIKPECFLDKESLEKWYGGAHGGFHKMYIVEIKNIYSE